MIYEDVDDHDGIRQGDVFFDVPKLTISLNQLAVVPDDDTTDAVVESWKNLVAAGKNRDVVAVVGIASVTSVVITQDCDASRGHVVHLAATTPFLKAVGQDSPPKNAKKWQSLITTIQRQNPRFFYLPASTHHHIVEPLAVDFRELLVLPREDLLELRTQRHGRLNHVARDHFRESIGRFYGRYAFNEWYPLDADQFAAYAEASSEQVKPYDWQKPNARSS